LIGIPISNRTRAELEGVVGFFVNTAVIRTDLTGEPSFRELMGRVREASLEAYAHQDAPFDMVVEALQPQRSLSRTPLFQVMFTLHSEAGSGKPATGSLQLESVGTAVRTARFDITLSMAETAQGLVSCLDYHTELFEAHTIERIARQFEMLLAGAVHDPNQRVNDIEILSTAEQQELLME